MIYLICDGSFEGLLSAVFDAYRMSPKPDGILLSRPVQGNMLDEYIVIDTDAEKAGRVQRGIELKLSPESMNHIRNAFASALPEAGTIIYRYIKTGFSIGAEVDAHLTHPDVLNIHNLSRRVGREVHMFAGVTRFKSTRQGVFYASILPDFNIVPLLAPHFRERLDKPFILHDTRHNIAALCRDGELVVVPVDYRQSDKPSVLPFEDDGDEELYASLWKLFYNSLAIKSRINHNLRRQNMPKKYWTYLTELKPD